MNVIPPEQRLNMSLEDVIKASHKDKKVAAKKPAAAKGKKPQNKRSNNNTPNSSTSKVLKNAKVVGAMKAKRNAAVDQRRGIRQSATPTKKEVKKATADAIQSSGLKITFSPRDLPKTTERVVTQQIRAVLSRQTTAQKNNSQGANRAIITPRNGAAAAAKKRNPKVRGKAVLKVKH